MGTNFYLRRNVCHHCGRGDPDLHIGKSSSGWQFQFRGYPDSWAEPRIKTCDDWRRVIQEYQDLSDRDVIHNEYGDPIEEGAFWRMVESKQGGKTTRSWYDEEGGYWDKRSYDKYNWIDKDGYEFCSTEFS